MSVSHYIYKITNLIDGVFYIGRRSTVVEIERDGYFGSGKLLRAAIVKHGKENFKKDIVCICGTFNELCEKEAEIVNLEFIARGNTYNIVVGGTGGTLGLKDSTETRNKKSVSGKNKPLMSAEARRNCSIGATGKKMSAEARRNNSIAQLGKKLTEDHKKNIATGLTGMKHTDEARMKMSKSQIGHKVSAEARDNLSKSTKGVPKNGISVTVFGKQYRSKAAAKKDLNLSQAKLEIILNNYNHKG